MGILLWNVLWNVLWIALTAIVFFTLGVSFVTVPKTYVITKFINNKVNEGINSKMAYRIENLMRIYLSLIVEINFMIMMIDKNNESPENENNLKRKDELLELVSHALIESGAIIKQIKESSKDKRTLNIISELEDLHEKTVAFSGITKYSAISTKGDDSVEQI